MEPSREISRLLEIMAALRDPNDGCPWDVEQDFGSIAPYTIEEAHEVADAIVRGDMVDLCDELGDLLLQVVFHARMAEEAGHFSFEDVVEAITRKMIRRHPHVFGADRVAGAKLAKGQWEAIKDEERREKAERKRKAGTLGHAASWLDDVPGSLPAMLEAIKLQRRAARVGFDWSQAEPILDKIEEELGELRAAMAGMEKGDAGSLADVREEWGDLAFALVNLARHLDVDPDGALKSCNRKFRTRFAAIEAGLPSIGKTLETASLDEMEALWIKAKRKAD